jgi:hypothetical protein
LRASLRAGFGAVVGCIESEGALERLIDAHAQAADMIANMDY